MTPLAKVLSSPSVSIGPAPSRLLVQPPRPPAHVKPPPPFPDPEAGRATTGAAPAKNACTSVELALAEAATFAVGRVMHVVSYIVTRLTTVADDQGLCVAAPTDQDALAEAAHATIACAEGTACDQIAAGDTRVEDAITARHVAVEAAAAALLCD
jgi:hypothetical protein